MWGEGRFRSEFPRPKARLRKALPAEKHFNLSLRLARLPVAPQAGAAATAYKHSSTNARSHMLRPWRHQ
jgi:hypothetical protein